MVLKALEIIESPDRKNLSQDEAQFVLANRFDLLPRMGRIKDLAKLHKDWLEIKEEMKDKRVPPQIQMVIWRSTLYLAAATGDYQLFQETVTEIEKVMNVKEPLQHLVVPLAVPLEISPVGWTSAPVYAGKFYLSGQTGPKTMWIGGTGWMNRTLVPLAEFLFLRGLMALEAGDVAEAEKQFERARQYLLPGTYFPDYPVVATYLPLIRRANDEK